LVPGNSPTLIDRYPEVFLALDRIRAPLATFLSDEVVLLRPSTLEVVKTAIATRAANQHRSVVLLLRASAQDDALILTRSLFELLLHTEEILRDPRDATERAQRFLDFALFQQHLESRELFAYRLDVVQSLLPGLTSIQGVNIFVFSVSELPDLLSQWRGYSPRAGGLSMALDLETLEPTFRSQGFRLAQCIYHESTQRRIIHELLLRKLSRSKDGYWFSARNLRVFVKELLAVAPILKAPEFSEEREWRLVSDLTDIRHPQVTFRATGSTIVPYFDLSIAGSDGKVPIRQVVVGPGPHSQATASSVSSLLGRHASGTWAVAFSTIPYRGW
jgi:hypothetical protein